ncbi:TetR/AcrR family transcriptional regulator C-terminal domain-containing protein [Ruania zhangjianzhongii]|uniref:TetR/AcrR family transcriptional regulator C-terminal domain-containing protein n=1 Tax=Ruania zhangjianzhongii TaxID=2603206 RepID=UPI0011CA6157|nr:TetR/AcrR family transcriptional regulator C-terminal domain-containing protein [Ruania zhangjianzhongii]
MQQEWEPGEAELDRLRQDALAHAADQGYPVVRSPEVTRRLELLWGISEPPTRGRKARIALADVVAAGVAVADRDGMEALSMRRVAGELVVGAMSLYTYVPGRAELVELMVDQVFGELELPAAGLGWREGLGTYARQTWRLYCRHPWLLQLNMWRGPLAPHVLDAQEAGLRTLAGTGLTAPEVVRTLALVDTVVQGTARADIAEDADRRVSGIEFDRYWESVSSFWTDYFDYSRYPTMARIYADGGFDATDDFEAALDRLLTVVELSLVAAGPTR